MDRREYAVRKGFPNNKVRIKYNGVFSITENLPVPDKEVIKMQDAYHYNPPALSIDRVCTKMIFLVY